MAISIFLRAFPKYLLNALAGLVVLRHAELEITIEQVTGDMLYQKYDGMYVKQ